MVANDVKYLKLKKSKNEPQQYIIVKHAIPGLHTQAVTIPELEKRKKHFQNKVKETNSLISNLKKL